MTERTDRFALDARWSLAIFVARSLSSLVFVLATSRALGSANYGALAALSAATSLAAVLTTSGVSHAATMYAARADSGGGSIVSAALRSGLGLATVVTFAYLALSALFDEITLVAALGLFVADVLVGGIAEIVASTMIGLRRFRSAAAIWVAFSAGRGLAAAIVVAGTTVSLTDASLLAMVCSLATLPVAGGAVRALRRSHGRPVTPGELLRSGGVFAAGNLVARLNNDFDKLLLSSRLGSVSSVGTYAVGYRLVEYSMLPLTALSAAAYPRMFRAGADGASSARALARRLTGLYVGTAALLAIGLFLSRGIVQSLFGPTYGDLSTVITMLLGIPVLRSIVNLLGEPLTGSGFHHHRVGVMLAALTVNVGVNVVLLGPVGWQAAVWATYASEAVQIALLVAIARSARVGTGERSAEPIPDDATVPA